ncbi:MAG: hypothetical protein PHH67_11205 [Methanosarcina sp.]|jgi:hypothetical protein|nr:hypothetical protein [Methanosarcina sp.]MDD3316592.1 hypothetical protein [Methanosarcina sp.]MDD4307048.1 hypothetical protein [Methanosarcina sp.]MDD4620183.1 hypothetical protein [Methanosarcina sp.]NLN43963.1 hypothetical protein [Methanosarcina sp.]
MIKFAHLLVLSALIVLLAGSGCVGNDTPDIEKTEAGPNSVEVKNGSPDEDLDTRLLQAEIQELNSEMEELKGMLEDANLEDEIIIEEL